MKSEAQVQLLSIIYKYHSCMGCRFCPFVLQAILFNSLLSHRSHSCVYIYVQEYMAGKQINDGIFK